VFQTYEFGTPPLAESALRILELYVIPIKNGVGLFMIVILSEVEHPFTSVTSTLYTPGIRFEIY
jgi:hypothetical protein